MTDTYEASAPGRLDVLGGITDYSGAAVLQLPIPLRTTVALTWLGEPVARVATVLGGTPTAAEVPLDALADLRQAGVPPWSSYVLGCLTVGYRSGLFDPRGVSFTVTSEVPVGAGLASSAALTVATWRVLAKAYDLALEPVRLAHLAQAVEHHVVGAPCGLMDQLAVHCGRAGHFLPILCRPDRLGPAIPVPPSWRLWGVDSGVRHDVGGEAYGAARAAAFMGRQILRLEHGLDVEYLAELAAVPPQLAEKRERQRVLAALPRWLSGADFLSRYGELDDPLSRVDPGREYAVAMASAFPVFEYERTGMLLGAFQELAQRPAGEPRRRREREVLEQLGAAMAISHLGYTQLGLGHAATDAIVAAVARAGQRAGLYGARVTGGGCGGTVVVAGEARVDAATLARLLGVEPARIVTEVGGE